MPKLPFGKAEILAECLNTRLRVDPLSYRHKYRKPMLDGTKIRQCHAAVGADIDPIPNTYDQTLSD